MDKEQELLTDEEVALVNIGAIRKSQKGSMANITKMYCEAQIAKLKSLGWVSPEVRKRDIKGAMEGTKQGMIDVGYEQVWEKCPECNNTGKVLASKGTIIIECTTCNGTGKVRTQFKLPEGIERELDVTLKRLFAEYQIKAGLPLGVESPDRESYIRPIWREQILSLIRQDKE